MCLGIVERTHLIYDDVVLDVHIDSIHRDASILSITFHLWYYSLRYSCDYKSIVRALQEEVQYLDNPLYMVKALSSLTLYKFREYTLLSVNESDNFVSEVSLLLY